MNQKGMVGMVATIIGVVILILLVANVLIPQVKTVTQAQAQTESLVRNAAPAAENDTLTKATAGFTLVDDSLVITGLTEGANYTVDYDTGIVTFNATVTVNGTYAAAYDYYETGYVDDTSERTLLAFLVFAAIIGVLMAAFKMFSLGE